MSMRVHLARQDIEHALKFGDAPGERGSANRLPTGYYLAAMGALDFLCGLALRADDLCHNEGVRGSRVSVPEAEGELTATGHEFRFDNSLGGSAHPLNPERDGDSVSGKGGRPGVGPSDSQPASQALPTPCPECGDFDCVFLTADEEHAACETCGADLVAEYFVHGDGEK